MADEDLPSVASTGRVAEERLSMKAARLAKNTAIHLSGRVIALLAAVVLIPYVIAVMGTARFGFLAMAWTAIGYFGFFDLGLGAASTHFVARAIGRGESERIPSLIWTAVLIQTAIGSVGALALTLVAGRAATLFTLSSPELSAEVASAVRLVGLAMPLVLVSTALRGALEAAQRFALTNAIGVPSAIGSLALPILGVYLGLHLPGIITLLLLARALTSLAFLAGCSRTFPGFWRHASIDRRQPGEMVRFGGWFMLAHISGPILAQAERFLIPVFAGVEALAFYAVPQEMVYRLALFPAALATTLFPAFSYFAARDQRRLPQLFARPWRYLLLGLTPIATFLAIFAEDVLRVWIGPEYAAAGAMPLRLLTVAFFLNALAYLPLVALRGMGRPDLKPRLDAIEVPLYLIMLVVLLPSFGIVGASVAKVLLAAVDLIGLLWLAHRLTPALGPGLFLMKRTMVTITSFSMLAVALHVVSKDVTLALGGFAVLTLCYGVLAWTAVIDSRDRGAVLSLLGRSAG